MAIRDVSGGPQKPAGAGGAQASQAPVPLDRSLADAGLVGKGGIQQAARQLLGNLALKGFMAPVNAGLRGDLLAQLAAALKSFQAQKGLKQTGTLDAQTLGALKDAGVVTPDMIKSQEKKDRDATFEKFEKNAPSILKHGEQRRADLVNAGSPDTNFLDALIHQLGPGGPNEGMSATDIRGTAHANEAQVQTKQHVEQARKGEGAQKKGTTADAQKEASVSTNQQLDKGNAQGVKVARGLRAEETKTNEKRRNDALQGKDPRELGILDEEAEEDAIEGTGEDGKRRRGRGGEHEGAEQEGSEQSASKGAGGDGPERDRGNAASGDRDVDGERGHASVDDGSGADAGHYRVPSVSEQCFAALAQITRDAAIENRATTYSWDVTFFKPGVYGPGQKAQELVHLVVDKATAFDPVWSKAQANLSALVKRLDPGGNAPSLDDIIQALRQARAREGGAGAPTMGKITRPIGKA